MAATWKIIRTINADSRVVRPTRWYTLWHIEGEYSCESYLTRAEAQMELKRRHATEKKISVTLTRRQWDGVLTALAIAEAQEDLGGDWCGDRDAFDAAMEARVILSKAV